MTEVRARTRADRHLPQLCARRRTRCRWRVPGGVPGRDRVAARAIGLRQDNHHAHDRRARSPQRRRHPHPRQERRRHPAASAQHRAGVPVAGRLSAHDRARERRLRPADAACPAARRSTERVDKMLELVRLPPAEFAEPLSEGTERRAIAAGCAGAHAGDGARGRAVRRADGGARPAAARLHGDRAAQHPEAAGHSPRST